MFYGIGQMDFICGSLVMGGKVLRIVLYLYYASQSNY